MLACKVEKQSLQYYITTGYVLYTMLTCMLQ